jgi:hypothetical protein
VLFAIGPGALVWTFLSEILPTKIRSIGMAIALTFSSLSGAAFTNLFLPLENRFGLAGIFMLCSVSALLYLMLSRLIPDTKGKSLEAIMHPKI